MEIEKIFKNDVDSIADNIFGVVNNSVSEAREMQKRKVAENVQLVVQALKKMESDIRDRYDSLTKNIENRVMTIKDGRDGINGKDGKDGKDGRPGRDGKDGRPGSDGKDGAAGRDGNDGVSVTNAKLDFDNSLVIYLSNGQEINVGEIMPFDVAEKIKVITNGGGTSQSVLDTLTSLQTQINALSSLGAVSYQGTWNASTNSPTITSGSGTKGYYYVVSTAGSTTIDGQSLWGVGDWIVYNGSVWQKVDGGSTGNLTTLDVSTSATFSYGTANGLLYLNGSKVATSGSALTFDGTNLGIGTSSPATALDVNGTITGLKGLIGVTTISNSQLRVAGNITGATTAFGILSNGTVQSDVTTSYQANRATIATAAAAFTLTDAIGYRAAQGTIGAGSAITNQYGFYADASLTGATNNYGFYSNSASGTGRWNFYAAGTADNYFGGPTTISTSSASDALRITQTGTGNALLVEDSTNPDSTPLVVNNAGQLVVGHTAAIGAGQNTNIQSQATSGLAGVSAFRWSNDTTPPRLQVGKSRSTTIGSYTIVQNGDQLGGVYFYGDDGTDLVSQGASIIASVDGTPGTDDMPGRLVFSTTADGASTPTERMRIDSSGNVLITSSGGLGYGTGSGGTVTQITSRTTGVTLNKTNGAITLVSAAGSTTWQSFTVTNSTIAATDTVIVNQKSGTDLYQIFVTNVAAGSFRISFATTGGTTTEQPVFNFAVIKAVTA